MNAYKGVLDVFDLGADVRYMQCLALQERLVDLRRCGRIPDTLLMLEHHPTITIGRSGGREDLLSNVHELQRLGIELCEANRGGRAMLHIPGQVVGYLILNLREHHCDVRWYVRMVEKALIHTLARWGINAVRMEHFPGVWVHLHEGWRKIGFIGVHVRHWITMHGFALNVCVNSQLFHLLKPCGFEPNIITDMASVRSMSLDINEVKCALAECIATAFNLMPILRKCA